MDWYGCDAGLAAKEVWANNHVWPRARRQALKRDGHQCRRCGATTDLHVHHIVPAKGDRTPGCQHHPDNLVTLCAYHHSEEHQFLRSDLPYFQLALALAA